MDVKVIVPHILHGVNSIVVRSEALAKPDALESAGRGPEIVHVRSPFIIHRTGYGVRSSYDFASGRTFALRASDGPTCPVKFLRMARSVCRLLADSVL
jgi:hypothetical protein